jgi:hypothetical protein
VSGGVVGFVWDVGGVEVGGDGLDDFWWDGGEVVGHFSGW